MSAEDHKKRGPKKIAFAVLTASDTRTSKNDAGGDLARELILAQGHAVVRKEIVPDELLAIRGAVAKLLDDPEVDAILVTGGSGIGSRDVSVESVSSLLQISLDGFGELFRSLSYAEIGAAAMLSRATAGIASSKPIFAIPGSPKGVRLGLERVILPEIGHILAELRR